MTPARLTFPKEERLCGQGRIAHLFSNGRSASAYPVRAWALERDLSVRTSGSNGPSGEAPAVDPALEQGPPFRVAFAVPKRRFKKAVDRNRVKRQFREAWRHAKAPFAVEMAARLGSGTRLDLVLLFTGKELPTYADLTGALEKLMPKLLAALGPEAQRSEQA